MANPLYSIPWLKDAQAKFARYFNTASFGGFVPVSPYNGLVTNLPSDAFKIANTDEVAASVRYYGYVTPDTGDVATLFTGWFIMRATLASGTWSAGVVNYEFANWDNGTGIAVGSNGVQYRTAVTGAWANRAALTFANYEQIF